MARKKAPKRRRRRVRRIPGDKTGLHQVALTAVEYFRAVRPG